VAVDDEEVAKKTPITFKFYADLGSCSDIIKTSEELGKYFRHDYGEDIEEWPHWAEAAASALDSGKVIIIGSFSDDNGPEEALLCEFGLDEMHLPESVKVLQGAGGY